MLNKCFFIIFFACVFSYSACKDFFLYHGKEIHLCNTKTSFEILEKANIKLYLKENSVYMVGKQSDVIHFLYESGFRLRQLKKINGKKFYEYSLDNIIARNGVKDMGEYFKKLFPEDIVCGEQENVFSISIEKKMSSLK